MEAVFWSMLVLAAYPYVLYPLCVRLLSFLVHKPITKSEFHPTVTVLTAAYNEGRVIAATVANKLAQNYPAEKLQVWVVSDASSDNTDAVVTAIAAREPRVRFIRNAERAGKTAALNLAMAQITSEIVVFADANSMFEADAVQRLVNNFADPEVGYVTGKMIYVDARGSVVGDGCTAYMRYENSLRFAETRIGSVVGVDGGIDAVRHSLYRAMRNDQLPDFVLPLNVVEQGRRVVFEPNALLQESTLTDSQAEFRMRVRVALRAFWALWDKKSLLLPWVSGLFSWQLLSHKLLRYLSFLPLLVAAVCCWVLALTQPLYLVLGLIALAAIFLAWLAERGLPGVSVFKFLYYFLLLNVASALAFAKFLAGQKQAIWQPRGG
jgi:cellulose synthase/poly-beta-1,6-N-acetylglucosamine synthase-like glycosyltransferase